MSIKKIHLHKLLRVFYSTAPARRTLLKADIYREKKKAAGDAGEGGDFFNAFWADAKAHTLGASDLHVQTQLRIQANKKTRARLYPELRDGFLTWWNEKRRWHNAPLYPLAAPAKAHLELPGFGTVKIEGVLGVRSEPSFQRLVYPYFAEKPPLSDEGGRLGLWALSQSLKDFDPDDFRVLDILRSRTFTLADYPLYGNEEEVFEKRYAKAIEDWQALWDEE